MTLVTWYLLVALASPAALAGARAEPADPLAEASAAANQRLYLKAVEKAMAVASMPKETDERRGKAFDLAVEAYLEMGCPRLAIATCHRALVALGREHPNALGAWARIAQIHIARQEYHEAITHLEKATAELDLAKLPSDTRIKLFTLLATCREQAGQPGAALAAYETLLATAQQGDDLSAVLAKAARLYAEFHRFDKAMACLDRLYGKLDGPTVAPEAAKAYQELAQKLPSAGRGKEGDSLDRRIIALFARKEPSTARAALLRLLDDADDAAALKLAASLQDAELRVLTSDEVLDVIVPAALRLGRTDEFVRLLTRAVLAEPFDETLTYACLKAIQGLRAREGRLDDALAAAYACYATTGFATYVSPTSFSRAVDLVADALRARDGHLVSGNAFRLYQVHGPAGPDHKAGTPDDLAHPLAGLAPKPDPERDKVFEAAIAAQPASVAGHRVRGWICLLWGKPKDALREFKREFAICSLESTELTRAAQDVALGLKALNATPVGMEAFADFQRHGPNGPDGKPNTPDDLKDPLAGL